MTVAEVIAKLSEFPPDMPVVIPGQGREEGAWVCPNSIERTTMSMPEGGELYTDPEVYEGHQREVVAFDCFDY